MVQELLINSKEIDQGYISKRKKINSGWRYEMQEGWVANKLVKKKWWIEIHRVNINMSLMLIFCDKYKLDQNSETNNIQGMKKIIALQYFEILLLIWRKIELLIDTVLCVVGKTVSVKNKKQK